MTTSSTCDNSRTCNYQLPAAYAGALETWLAGYSQNTRRGYLRAVRAFFAFVGRPAEEITAPDVAHWKAALQSQGLATGTVKLRLTALSSFLAYLVERNSMGESPSLVHNPAAGVGRRDLRMSPFGLARKIASAEFQSILKQIDAQTARGARDRALFLFYVLCARRRTEVLALRGGDIRVDNQKVVYRVRLKGGAEKWKELPAPVWRAYRVYLDLAGRQLEDDTPLFVASRGRRRTPLTAQAALNALRYYAERAGLDPRALTLHSLRHLGAELFYEASKDVRQTQMFLDHAYLNTTQIYLQNLADQDHHHWQQMCRQIGE